MSELTVSFVSVFKNGNLQSSEALDLATGRISVNTPVCEADLLMYGDLEKEYIVVNEQSYPVSSNPDIPGYAYVSEATLLKLKSLELAEQSSS